MTFDETKTMLATLTTIYPEKFLPKIDKAAITIWHDLIQDLPNEQVQAAVVSWIMTNKYPPTIADIRSAVIKPQLKIESAEDAWKKVMYALKHFGSYGRYDAEDYLGPAIWKVVDIFGWRHFCEMTEDGASTNFAQFRNVWKDKMKEAIERVLVPGNIQQALEGESRKEIGDGEQ